MPVGVQIANPYKPGQCQQTLHIEGLFLSIVYTGNTQVCPGCRPEIKIDMRSQNRTAVLIGSTNSPYRKETMGISTETCEVWGMESIWARNPALLTTSRFLEPNYLTHAVLTLLPRPPPPSFRFTPIPSLSNPPLSHLKNPTAESTSIARRHCLKLSRQQQHTRPLARDPISPESQLMDCRTVSPLGMFSCLSILKLPPSLF